MTELGMPGLKDGFPALLGLPVSELREKTQAPRSRESPLHDSDSQEGRHGRRGRVWRH